MYIRVAFQLHRVHLICCIVYKYKKKHIYLERSFLAVNIDHYKKIKKRPTNALTAIRTNRIRKLKEPHATLPNV